MAASGIPSLTVRSFAEMLNLPAYTQARILTEQKHPKQAPQVFRTPYYQYALTGIRSYYKADNDPAQLALAAAKVEALKKDARRDHNLRILNSFKLSDMRLRQFKLAPSKTVAHTIADIELRLSPDLRGVADGKELITFLNLRAQPLDTDLARTTIELAHWLLEKHGVEIPLKRIEFVDLFKGTTHTISKRRATTITAATQNLKIIQTLWPSL
jgi:hypothetical protein